jgi:Rieske Fe-S protein
MDRNDPAELLARSGPSRRTVLAVGTVGASALALTACSKAPSSTGSAPTAGGSATAAAPTGPASAGGSKAVLAALASVPVGSAVAAKGTDGGDILIARPAENTVAAFSAICPHQGCTVAPSFQCPCHGSTFDPHTGANLSGPAPTGLTVIPVAISGTNIVAG